MRELNNLKSDQEGNEVPQEEAKRPLRVEQAGEWCSLYTMEVQNQPRYIRRASSSNHALK